MSSTGDDLPSDNNTPGESIQSDLEKTQKKQQIVKTKLAITKALWRWHIDCCYRQPEELANPMWFDDTASPNPDAEDEEMHSDCSNSEELDNQYAALTELLKSQYRESMESDTRIRELIDENKKSIRIIKQIADQLERAGDLEKLENLRVVLKKLITACNAARN